MSMEVGQDLDYKEILVTKNVSRSYLLSWEDEKLTIKSLLVT